MLLVALAGAGVAACGFQPMYRQDRASDAVQQFSSIDIRADKRRDYTTEEERLVQMVRNELLDRLQPKGAPLAPRFVLVIDARESRSAVLVTRTESVSRFNLAVGSVWQLLDSRGGVLTYGTVNTLESYNVLRQEFANLSAETDARQRAARDIADQLRIRLALYFERSSGS